MSLAAVNSRKSGHLIAFEKGAQRDSPLYTPVVTEFTLCVADALKIVPRKPALDYTHGRATAALQPVFKRLFKFWSNLLYSNPSEIVDPDQIFI